MKSDGPTYFDRGQGDQETFDLAAVNSEVNNVPGENIAHPENHEKSFFSALDVKFEDCLQDTTYTKKYSLIWDLIEELKSFDKAIEWLITFAEKNPSYADLSFSLIRNAIQYYTTPIEFPVDKIRGLQEKTVNDIEWQDFEALVALREEIFDFSKYSSHDARYIVSVIGKDICFDVEKTRKLALEFMAESEDSRYFLLGSLYKELCEVYSNYEGEQDPPLAIEEIQKYEQMKDGELLQAVPAGYSYNLVMEHVKENSLFQDEDSVRLMLQNIHLPENAVFEKMKSIVSNDINAYQYAGALIEMQAKHPYDASRFLQSYVFPDLSDEARNRHIQDFEKQHNFLLNSSALQAKGRLLMFDPQGDILGITERLPEPNKEVDVPTALKMSTFLFDSKLPRKVTSVAVALTFFGDLPKDLQEEVWQTANQAHPNLDWDKYFYPDFVYSFETAVWCAEEVARYFPDNLYDKIASHVNTVLATGMKELPFVEFEETTKIIQEMEEEFGKETFDAEQMVKTFKAINFQSLTLLKETTNIDFNSVSLREFFILLNILQKNNHGKGFNKIKKLLGGEKTSEQRNNRLRSLLSFELDKNMDNIISRIDDVFSPDTSDKIFEKCSELIATINKVEDFFLDNFTEQKYSKSISSSIKKSILQQAGKLLTQSYDVLSGLEFQEQQTIGLGILDRSFDSNSDEHWAEEYEKMVKEETRKLEVSIEKINASTLLFLNSFRTLKESDQEVSLEDIKNSKFEQKEGGSILETDVSAMRNIYDMNQSEMGAHDEILSHFDERVKSPDAHFYIFKWQEKIQSFVAFEPSKRIPGALEASSFNVDPSARGYKIGEAMLDEAIAKEAKGHVLEAECYTQLAISSKYIETGWVGEGFFAEPGKKKGTTDTLLNIRRDDAGNKALWGKSLSTEEIIAHTDLPLGVLVDTADTQSKLRFQLCNEGYLLTRMFFDKSHGVYVGVFEKLQ